jgi:hypothetical protein
VLQRDKQQRFAELRGRKPATGQRSGIMRQQQASATGHATTASRPPAGHQRTASARPPAAGRRPAESAGQQQGLKYGHHGANSSAPVHHYQRTDEQRQRPDFQQARSSRPPAGKGRAATDRPPVRQQAKKKASAWLAGFC